MSDKEKDIINDKITVNVRVEPYVVVHEDNRPEVKFNVVLEDTEGDKIVCGYSWLKDWLCKVEPELKLYIEQVKIVPFDSKESN